MFTVDRTTILPDRDALRKDGDSLLRKSPTDAPTISIVIPMLNEQASVPQLIEQIETALGGTSYEVIFVDDGSDDDSWRVIQESLHHHPQWQGLRLSRRFGHQAALFAGLSAARGQAVIMMDADGQHPAHLIPDMIERWHQGARVVQMIRAESKDAPWLKQMTARSFYRVFSVLCEVPITEAAADFRLLDRSVVDLVLQGRGPTPFLRGLVPWLGLPTVELTYEPQDRFAGRTKYSFARMTRLALHGLLSFSIVPLRLGIWIGLMFATLAFGYLCYIIWTALFNEAAVPGWASIAGLVALLGGIQLFCVGLLGEYVGRLYTAQLDRPRFVVEQALGAPNPRAGGPRHTTRTHRPLPDRQSDSTVLVAGRRPPQ